MEFHPIANILPMMSDEELSELSKDITSNGLRVPILLHEGKILDGRSRYQACESSVWSLNTPSLKVTIR